MFTQLLLLLVFATTSYPTLARKESIDGYEFLTSGHANHRVYGFDDQSACVIYRDIGGIYALLQHARTIEKTAPFRLRINDSGGEIPIDCCFFYNGYSYVVHNNPRVNHSTTITRGQTDKMFQFEYDFIKFDHLHSKLYLIRNQKLYQLDLTSLEKYWTPNSHNRLNLMLISPFNTTFSDIMIVDNTIYYISDWAIFKSDLKFSEPSYISDTTTNKFGFVLFPPVDHSNNNIVMGEFAEKNLSSITILTLLIEIALLLIYHYVVRGKRERERFLSIFRRNTPLSSPLKSPDSPYQDVLISK